MFLLQLLIALLEGLAWLPPGITRDGSRRAFRGVRGVVDRTRGGLCVATEFRCVLGFPVRPKFSRVYRAEAVNLLDGEPIPLNARSVRAAYLRAGCWVGVVVAVVATLVAVLLSLRMSLSPRWAGYGMLATVGTFAAAVTATRLYRHASPARADELSRIARRAGPAFGFEVKTAENSK